MPNIVTRFALKYADKFDVRRPGWPQVAFTWLCMGWMTLLVALNAILHGPPPFVFLKLLGLENGRWDALIIGVKRFLVGDFLG